MAILTTTCRQILCHRRLPFIHDQILMICHDANLSENEASVAWGQGRGRGQILRGWGQGQGQKIWPWGRVGLEDLTSLVRTSYFICSTVRQCLTLCSIVFHYITSLSIGHCCSAADKHRIFVGHPCEQKELVNQKLQPQRWAAHSHDRWALGDNVTLTFNLLTPNIYVFILVPQTASTLKVWWNSVQ